MIEKQLKGHKKQFKDVCLIIWDVFEKSWKKLRLTPLLFSRFWPLFQLFKNRSKMIEKQLKGHNKQFKDVCLIFWDVFEKSWKKVKVNPFTLWSILGTFSTF